MKLITTLLIIGILNSYAGVYSQDISISVNIKNGSLTDLFNAIEKNTEFKIFYKSSLIDNTESLSLNADQIPVSELLTLALSGRNLSYDLVDKVIVITPSDYKQQQRVTGTITDASTNEPLPGVNITVEGTTLGTVTDIDGKYSIEAPNTTSVLVFSFVGYTTQKISLEGKSVIDVKLQPDITKLEEVVVVGYGTQKVKDLTSAISTIKSEDLIKTPSGQAMQSLQGKVPGLQVVSSGTPGTSPTIRVRGVGSYPGTDVRTGNPLNTESPLFVVDGIFFDNIDFLNPADIASISVLKDASASAIYGVRAANGVVLIETKSGSTNQKAVITYDGYYGMQIAQNILKMANAEQFTTMAMESGSAPDAQYILNAMQRYGRSRKNPNVPDVNTDWYKEILRPAAIQNHSFGVSGGSEKISYSLGASYFGQEGILDTKNDYERFNIRSKIDYKAKNWLTVGGNAIFSTSTRYGEEYFGWEKGTAWNQAYYAVPIMPVYDEQNLAATPIKFASAQTLGYRSGQNPFPTLKFNDNFLKAKNLISNFYVEVGLIPKILTFKTTYNLSYTSLDDRNVDLPYYVSDALKLVDPSIRKTLSNNSNQTWDNILTFNKTFGNHNLTALAGVSYRDEDYYQLSARGLNFPADSEQSWYIDQSPVIVEDDVRDDAFRQYGLSYFGRLAYNFKDKYLVYGTMRADGTSKYQQRWGYFPTVGVGWVISEESFLKNVTFLNYLKLRASWGQLGNNKIQASDGQRTTTVITTAINGVLVAGNTTSDTFSALEWEVTEETNMGITSRFLKDRLSIDADYFIRDTKNATINVMIPSIGTQVLRNVGVIRNSGLELSLNWSDKLSGDFRYNIGGNFSTLKNEVRNLYGQPYVDGGQAEFRQRSIVGHPLMAFFGYEVAGVYQNDAEVQADPIAVANGLVPGDFKYKDQDNNGVIDDKDRVVLGSYFPTFSYGANLGLSFKNLDFSVNMLGQNGNKIVNRKRGEFIWTPDGNMDADLAKNRWHGEGTSNKYPSSAGLRKGWNQKMSTYFVEDGSFFRIQNVQLAYNIKGKHLMGALMPDARVYVTAERPLTIFKYNGFNPEVPNGVDTQTYPIPAVYTVGLSLKF